MNRSFLLCSSISLALGLMSATAAPPPPPAPTAFDTPLKLENLDPDASMEWVEGKDRPIQQDPKRPHLPEMMIWAVGATDKFAFSYTFGDTNTPGARYLRLAFKEPVTVGTILARGQVQVSVLKPDATYPGNMADDSQWIPAQRLKNGVVVDTETGVNDEALWVLPSVVSTRAIRFKHVSQMADRVYGGQFGGAYVFPDRWANLAPQAAAAARTMSQNASRLNDEATMPAAWGNISARDGVRSKTIAEDPEWIMLVWPKPVTLQGLALLGVGFDSADVQTYNGPADKHPRSADDSDWTTVKSVSDLKYYRISPLAPQWVDFGTPVTTRAVRLRLTKAFDPKKGVNTQAVDGKRVWIDDVFALQALNKADLKSAVLPVVAIDKQPPIPIKFSLPDAGNVTLVIEDSTGKRVRNLIADTPFPQGKNTVYWDGTDDLGRDVDAARHGLYNIPPELVAPGTYTVRGLWHKPFDLQYELSVYSPGDPPWSTQDNTGGWMTNHTPASCVVFMPGEKAPGGQPLVGIGAYVSEGGSAFSWVNLDGRKLGGRGWIGGVWTGAQYLAADLGPNAEPGVATYVGSVFEGNAKYGVNGKIEVRLTKLTTLVPEGDKPVMAEKILLDPLPPQSDAGVVGGTTFPKPADYLGGLAVYNGLMVISETALNKVVFIDAKGGKIIGEMAMTDPRACTFDGQGRLLLLSGKTLLRYPAEAMASAPNLPQGENLVSGFEDPRGLAVDSTGKIYVADQGESHQVKIFTSDGKPALTIGHPGVPKGGPYDPLHLNHPKGLAVDSNGRLWVAEDDYQPKRVSVWNADGTLWKAFYGPQQYGGGGSIDSQDKTLYSYDGMEFKIDWDKADSMLQRVYYRLGQEFDKGITRFAPPEWVLHFNGKRYMTNEFNSSPTSGASTVFIYLDNGDVAVPVAGFGRTSQWDVLKSDEFKPNWPAGIDPNAKKDNEAIFIWSDLNNDGKPEPDEVKMWAGRSGGVTIGNDGSFVVNNVKPDEKTPGQAMRYKPVKFTDQGVPVYDPAKGEVLADANGPTSSGGDQALLGTDGWTVLTNAPRPFAAQGLGGARNAVSTWSYPSLWPGLHASHEAPVPDRPGEMIGTTRLLGDMVTPKGSDAGPIFFINSNQGNMYAVTQDGLFVTQFFRDVRQGELWKMPKAERGMLVNDVSLHDENFFPTVSQVPDGSIYMMTGGIPAIVQVQGMESIHRLTPTTVTISADDLKLAQAYVTQREAARQAAQGSGILPIAIRSQAPAMNAGLQDWADAEWASIDQRGTAAYFNSKTKPYDVKAAVTIANGNLYALWQTDDPKLLENSGDIDNAPFKTGGALDLMIGTDSTAKTGRTNPVAGDLRLLITQVKGKTKAELYRAVVPGTPANKKVPFAAPWHSITMDSVTDVSDKVQLAEDKNGNYEVAVPLDLLGLKPQDGMKISADVGILRGNGTMTTQRVYWNNKATAIVSDVPSEAMLMPGLWGIWEFKSK